MVCEWFPMHRLLLFYIHFYICILIEIASVSGRYLDAMSKFDRFALVVSSFRFVSTLSRP